MGIFERGLTLWIGLALLLGLGLGQLAPSFFSTIGELEYANVNLVIAVLVWLMIYPMMLHKLKLQNLKQNLVVQFMEVEGLLQIYIFHTKMI